MNLSLAGPDGVQATIIRLQYLSNSKTTSNSCCINLGHTGPDGEQVAKEKRTPTFNEVIRLGIGLHRTSI